MLTFNNGGANWRLIIYDAYHPSLSEDLKLLHTQKILAVDITPSGEKASGAVGAMQQLRVCCDQRMVDGLTDTVVDIDLPVEME